MVSSGRDCSLAWSSPGFGPEQTLVRQSKQLVGQEAPSGLWSQDESPGAHQPLAARMRPRRLEEFVGQEAILGPGKMLRRMIERDELRSAIFFGPPGSGKSTLAALVAHRTRAHFQTFSAVTAGVADVRKAIQEARARYKESA